MSRKPSDKAEDASPDKATTTSGSGYPEKHGPRSDADGWGEANPDQSQRAGKRKGANQGQAAGKRSFDGGHDYVSDDPAEPAADAADADSPRFPGGPDVGDKPD